MNHKQYTDDMKFKTSRIIIFNCQSNIHRISSATRIIMAIIINGVFITIKK